MTSTYATRRRFLQLANAATVAAIASPRVARAAQWQPAKTVRIVVPFAPAGANDIIARVLAERLGAMWGQTVVVENKPGAGSNIGSADIARSDPDGHHILITSSAVAVNRFLYSKLPFDPDADLAPVSLVAVIPNLLVVPAAAKEKSVAEFIARAKAEPGKLNYGSAGIGSSLHLIGELFKKQTGTDMKHVPYRGAAPAMTDLIAGRIDAMFDTATISTPHVRSGAIRALGISTKERLPTLSEVPPIADTLPGFDVGSWFAMFHPGKTPPDVSAKIAADIREALGHDAVKQRMADLGARLVGSSPGELAALVKSETERWGPLIKEAGIRVE